MLPEYDPSKVVLQVACTDYEAGSSLVAEMLGNMATIAGTRANLSAGRTEKTLGWTFYILSVDKYFVHRLADLPENDIMNMRGRTLDQKFAVWLNRQLKTRMEGISVELLSDLRTSKFGLF